LLPIQCKMARTALGLGVRELASSVGVSPDTIARLERGESLREATILAVQSTLEAAGVIFVAENGDGPGVRLRKQREDRNNLDQHIEQIERQVADLKPAASGKPSPDTGMAMLRRGRAKSDLARAKNKRARDDP
jgi:transcriptional regulator with XRE-family HTH domain